MWELMFKCISIVSSGPSAYLYITSVSPQTRWCEKVHISTLKVRNKDSEFKRLLQVNGLVMRESPTHAKEIQVNPGMDKEVTWGLH